MTASVPIYFLYGHYINLLIRIEHFNNDCALNLKVKYMGTKSLRDEELQEQLQQHQLQQKPAPLPLASTPLQSTPMRRPPPPPTAESPHTEQIQAESPLSKLAIPGLASEGKKSDREWRPSEKSYTLNRSRTRSGDSETETDNDFDFEGGRGASQRGQGGFRAPVVVTTNASHPSPVSADLSLRSFADRSDFLDMEKSQGVASSSQMGSNQNRLREGYETKQSPSLRAVEPKGFNRLDESTIDEYDGDGGQGWAGITSGGRENPSPSQRSVITMDTAPGVRSTRSQQDGRAAEPLRAQDELMEADNRMPVVRDSWKSAKTISSLKPTTYDNKIYENKQASKDWQSDNFDTNANESYSRGLMETVSESGSDEKGNVLQVRKISYASQSDSISKSSRGNISMNTETLVTACSEKVDTASSNSIPATARGFTSSNGPVVLPRANANICDTSDVGFGFGSELDVQSAGLGLAKSDRRLKNSSTSSGNKNITDSKFDDDVRAQRTDRYSPLFVTDEKVDGPVSNEKSRSMNSRNYNISSDNQTRTDSSSDSELYQNGSSPTTSQGFHQSKLPDRVGKSIRSSTLVSMDREVSIEELERKSARCSPEKCRNCMKNLCSSNSFSNQDCGHHAIMTAPVLMQSTSRRSSPSRLTHRRRRADERSSPTDMVLVGSSSLPLAAKDFEMQVALLKKKILLLETESKAHQMERDTLRSEFKRNEDLWVAELSLLTRRNLILEEESKQLKEDMQNFKIQNTIKDAKMSVLEGKCAYCIGDCHGNLHVCCDESI